MNSACARKRDLEPATLSALDAIQDRRSVRAFLPTPVPMTTVERILEIAARAPSGTNMQPWQVIVLTGAALADLGRELATRSLAGDEGQESYAYYPRHWREPYVSRRRKVGWDLYTALGIARGEKEKMARQLARNYVFFGAPVGLLFTIDRDLEIGSWLDYGMFLENIMIAARSFGLDTCPQQAFARYHDAIAARLSIPADRTVVCGMSLGYANPAAPENRFATERAPVDSFVQFVDRLA